MPRALLAGDTTAEAERLQVKLWRSMSPLRKAQLTGAVSQRAVDLALAGLRRRHPEARRRELQVRLARMTLGTDLTRAAYPDAAELLAP